jgi:hypothetical protein
MTSWELVEQKLVGPFLLKSHFKGSPRPSQKSYPKRPVNITS